MKANTEIYVKRMGTDEVVHTIKVQLPRSERSIERIVMGILRNTDLDKFYVDSDQAEKDAEAFRRAR